jgi:hypothetical protein
MSPERTRRCGIAKVAPIESFGFKVENAEDVEMRSTMAASGSGTSRDLPEQDEPDR